MPFSVNQTKAFILMGRTALLVVTASSALIWALAGLPLAGAAHAQTVVRPYEPPEYHDGQTHYENKEERFGQFTVIRYVEDCRAVPMLDYGCWLTKEARLEWHDSTGAIGLAFVDNGGSVQFKMDVKSIGTRTTCLSPGVMVGYDPKPSTEENWTRLRPFISKQIRGCNVTRPADLDRALAEMQSSSVDFVVAANAWKAVAMELHGSSSKRCIRERMAKSFTMPPRFECLQYSKP